MEKKKINFVSTEIHNQEVIEESHNPRRVLFLILILIGLALIAGCVVKSIVGYHAPNDPTAYDTETLEPKKPEGFLNKITHYVLKKTYKLNGERDDRINVLLLGMGGIGHDGPFLTDTNIIASFKPSTGQIAMISIPRDLGAKIPGHGWYKINHANAFGEAEKQGGGGELAKKVVEDTFNLDIHYYVRVDFSAFSEIIDAVGGVTVKVDTGFVDEMYPAKNYEYQRIEFSSGIQIMDSDTALKFVRSRHGSNGEGSDFARAKRQQKVLFALREKLLSFSTLANPLKINKILSSLDKHITTDLEFSDIMSFLRLVKDLDSKELITVVLDDGINGFLKSSISPNGAFILEPNTGNFNEINEMIANVFEKKPTIITEVPEQIAPSLAPANIEIQNGTWIAGMAARMRKRLQDKGFFISSVGNTEDKPVEISGIYKTTSKDLFEVTSALSRELHVPIKENLPIDIKSATSTEILIILGNDIKE